jgi:putative endonuclease
MADNILSGRNGEEMAVTFLKSKGYTILLRNYRYKRSEVDIIAGDRDTLVFIEVKFRSGTLYGNPEEYVTAKKEQMIRDAAENYIETQDWKGNIRFDIVSIIKNERIVHFEDAF